MAVCGLFGALTESSAKQAVLKILSAHPKINMPPMGGFLSVCFESKPWVIRWESRTVKIDL